MMDFNDDHIALAAEYALGTLDADERAQVELTMAANADFQALVESWERIRVAAGLTAAEPTAEPVAPTEVAEAPPSPSDIIASDQPITPEPPPTGLSPESKRVVHFAVRARLWRWGALGMGAMAASFFAIIVAQLFEPEILPPPLRPAVRTQIVRVATPPPPMPAQYVALLQSSASSPAFILTVDSGSKKFTVRKVGASQEPGKSYELWLVSDKLQRPRSLGVIGGNDFTTRAALAAFDDDVMHKATYAVTIEPEGGSPTGIATGPIVYTGKLMETVPQGTLGK